MLGREVELASGVPVRPTGVRHGEGQDRVQQKKHFFMNLFLCTDCCRKHGGTLASKTSLYLSWLEQRKQAPIQKDTNVTWREASAHSANKIQSSNSEEVAEKHYKQHKELIVCIVSRTPHISLPPVIKNSRSIKKRDTLLPAATVRTECCFFSYCCLPASGRLLFYFLTVMWAVDSGAGQLKPK